MTDAPQPLILLIEDDAAMRRFLKTSLTGSGYRVVEAETGEEGILQATSRNPDLILLDLGLPDHDGLTVAARLRAWGRMPILVLSARGQEEDKVKALDGGADDYLTKPFGMGELLARVRVALRHAATTPLGETTFSTGGLRVDFTRREVTVEGRAVHLTPIEYKLLTTLVANAGRVVTHRQLLKEVWGPGYGDQTHYTRVYMAQLRHKLEADPSRPAFLVTEPGVGYRLRVHD